MLVTAAQIVRARQDADITPKADQKNCAGRRGTERLSLPFADAAFSISLFITCFLCACR